MKELPAIKIHCLAYTKKNQNGPPKVWQKIHGSSVARRDSHSERSRRIYPDLPDKETWIIGLSFYSN